MMTAQALARLSVDDFRIEGGATAEALVQVGSPEKAGSDSSVDFAVRVAGLPPSWYTLAAPHLQVAAGEWAETLLVIHPPRDDSEVPFGEFEFAVEVEAPSRGQMVTLPAHIRVLPPGAVALRSRLLDYLPALFRNDDFMARFLLIFESIIDPIEETIGGTHHYFDPGLAPAAFLPWLATWVGLELDPRLEEAEQRRLILRAVELARWKGTRRAMHEELKIRTGGRALIVENFDGMRLGQDAALGLNCHLGVQRDQCAVVTLAVDTPAAMEPRKAEAAVDELKPANVGHVVRIVPTPSRMHGGGNG